MTSQLNSPRTLRRQLARAEKRHRSAQALWLLTPTVPGVQSTLTSAELALSAVRKRMEACCGA